MTEDIQIGKLQQEINILQLKLDDKTYEANSLKETLTNQDFNLNKKHISSQ